MNLLHFSNFEIPSIYFSNFPIVPKILIFHFTLDHQSDPITIILSSARKSLINQVVDFLERLGNRSPPPKITISNESSSSGRLNTWYVTRYENKSLVGSSNLACASLDHRFDNRFRYPKPSSSSFFPREKFRGLSLLFLLPLRVSNGTVHLFIDAERL